MRCLIAVVMLFVASLASASEPSDTCHEQVPCEVGDRSYHILEPDGWDGESPLPVLFHFFLAWDRIRMSKVSNTFIEM